MTTLGPLVIDVRGTALSDEDREVICHPLVGGIILFARNYESPNQIKSLVRNMRACREAPLIIMVDQEGGRVQRFIDGFTRLPPAAFFGELYEKNQRDALKQARESGHLMAREILSVGIDLSLAPVLDLNKSVSKVIGDRAFHASPEGVSALAYAYIQGMHDAGMASTGKHFPGHGSVVVDSHLGIPVDERTMDVIMQEDLIPFARLIKQGLRAVLAAHIIFPAVDPLAAGYSRYWLQDILRQTLHFEGPILTDDLNMEGANISKQYADRVVAAREAGCDFALLCNNRPGVIQVLDHVPHAEHRVAPDKWRVLAGDFLLTETR